MIEKGARFHSKKMVKKKGLKKTNKTVSRPSLCSWQTGKEEINVIGSSNICCVYYSFEIRNGEQGVFLYKA